MKSIDILAGRDKPGKGEDFERIHFERGEMVAVIGNTGSGKSRLIKDIEQLTQGDSVTRRTVLLDGIAVDLHEREHIGSGLIAHLGQNMKFVLDTNVDEFIEIHITCRGNKEVSSKEVITLANSITPEPVLPGQNLTTLSGGQARALMIADIALICQSPVVLIDEIENAGIDKKAAFHTLIRSDKLVIIVTHDPHTALMCHKRILMKNGGVQSVITRNEDEKKLLVELDNVYAALHDLQMKLRKGEKLA